MRSRAVKHLVILSDAVSDYLRYDLKEGPRNVGHAQLQYIYSALEHLSTLHVHRVLFRAEAASCSFLQAQTANDAKAICSSTSVFVAAFEQLAGCRIQGIQRSPTGITDRVENCHRVVSLLETT
jgi:hypothetical protein